ncbi:hypothetical protein B9479_008345 [Cryptococcus floricola]|uniref:Uncharacterized protein n=1 Tax=Cryptococcus floricola TaxID=2591691 RepID=A0A5D3AM67_9TREE|nr:hypothetical protein B9479_008345 [Cryptococcus floricola]
MLPHDDPANKALPAGGVPHDDLPPPIGGVAPKAKLEGERREAKDEGESGTENDDGFSHEESVHSDPRPRLRQDTPWAATAPVPASDMSAVLNMMATMQKQIVDLLARERSTPAPAPV